MALPRIALDDRKSAQRQHDSLLRYNSLQLDTSADLKPDLESNLVLSDTRGVLWSILVGGVSAFGEHRPLDMIALERGESGNAYCVESKERLKM